ncbi:hypothetical protein [Thiopseudomonas alkaliphila]|uniref:hypothetical protein n=1 Tax=Thiopseudomonas alkaliphila TaxID=1697053 RepID=UPI00069DE9B5|nr:hypothetical protein [Thiopseudomonas alkaliphila]AKX53513.1 hypothetical protein AKN91_07380 [Thiopseudomonas alkaliphila]
MKHWIFVLAFLVAPLAHADLMVSFIDESRLPYDFSPSNYDNSSSNYDNSVSNYDNSPSNYDNSESNYDNSSSNYDNGANGDNRLLMKEGSKLYRVGYYVRADNGVTNFFSSSGKRIFYNPKKGLGVFHGKKGFFCGVLARVENEYQLVLTEVGQKTLLMAQ